MAAFIDALDRVTKYQFFLGLLGLYLFVDIALCYQSGEGVLNSAVSWNQLNPLSLMGLFLLYSSISLWFFPFLKGGLIWLWYQLIARIHIHKNDEFSATQRGGVFIHHAIDYAFCTKDNLVLDVCKEAILKQEEAHKDSDLALSTIILIGIDLCYSNGFCRTGFQFLIAEQSNKLDLLIPMSLMIMVMFLLLVLLKDGFSSSGDNYVLNPYMHKTKIKEIKKWIEANRKG